MAKLMKADGTVESFDFANSTLKEQQAAVGGYIEHAPMPDGCGLFVVNEEGKLKGLPVNDEATLVYQRVWNSTADYLVGDVIYVSASELARTE